MDSRLLGSLSAQLSSLSAQLGSLPARLAASSCVAAGGCAATVAVTLENALTGRTDQRTGTAHQRIDGNGEVCHVRVKTDHQH